MTSRHQVCKGNSTSQGPKQLAPDFEPYYSYEMVFVSEENYSSSDTMSHVGKFDEERAEAVEVVPQSHGEHLANPVRRDYLL